MKKIVRLTESDLVRLVKRVINEQTVISQEPYLPSVNIAGKTLKEGDKILISNKKIDINQLKSGEQIVDSYYGIISELEELNDGTFTIKVNGGYVPVLYLQTALDRNQEPMKESNFGTADRPCLKITYDRKPSYIDNINFGKGNTPVLIYSSLNVRYLSNPLSSCESQNLNQKLKDLGIQKFK